jgi:DNA-binding NarL/FixJ family response regulator
LVARASSASHAHVTRILAKLGLRDRVPAAVLAHERGFIQAEPS